MFPPSRIVCLSEETVEPLYLLGEQDYSRRNTRRLWSDTSENYALE
jgi:hypothetical protein